MTEGVGAVVLAAGRSRRMGCAKVALSWRGRALVAHVVAAVRAAGICPVVVVTGPDTPPLVGLAEDGVEVVFHARAREGLGSSLAAGVRSLQGRTVALLVCLGDEPGLRPQAVHAVVSAWDAAGRGPAASGPQPLAAYPVYRGGVRGHPVLFAAALYAELAALRGDVGARGVLHAYPALAVPLDLAPPRDVDTPEDYRLLVEGDAGP